jgi:pentatricopeptide repeat protein
MQQPTPAQNDSSSILHDPPNPVIQQPTHTQNDSPSDSQSNSDMQQSSHPQNASSKLLHDPESTSIMQQPTHLNYTMQIMAAISSKNIPSCFQIAAKMKSYGIKPDISTYNALMDAIAKEGNSLLSWAIMDDMLLVGVQPTTTTFVHFIDVIMAPFSLPSFSFDRHF